MSQLIHIDQEYAEWIQTVCTRFKQFQIKTAIRINAVRKGGCASCIPS